MKTERICAPVVRWEDQYIAVTIDAVCEVHLTRKQTHHFIQTMPLFHCQMSMQNIAYWNLKVYKSQ